MASRLPLSQYAEVWRTLLLMAAAISILDKAGTPEFLQRYTKLKSLKRTIDAFYQNVFSQEIVKMLSFVESAEAASSLIAKYGPVEASARGKRSLEIKDTNIIFQTNLLTIRHAFEDALKSLKLEKNVLIFIEPRARAVTPHR